jgi:hypothetical protein
MEKILNQKSFNYFVSPPLCSRVKDPDEEEEFKSGILSGTVREVIMRG